MTKMLIKEACDKLIANLEAGVNRSDIDEVGGYPIGFLMSRKGMQARANAAYAKRMMDSGYNQREIAESIMLSPGRVSQLLNTYYPSTPKDANQIDFLIMAVRTHRHLIPDVCEFDGGSMTNYHGVVSIIREYGDDYIELTIAENTGKSETDGIFIAFSGSGTAIPYEWAKNYIPQVVVKLGQDLAPAMVAIDQMVSSVIQKAYAVCGLTIQEKEE